MNNIYKTIWNASVSCMQVVSELASGHANKGAGSARSTRGLVSATVFHLALLPTLVWAAVGANELPQGGVITSGNGSLQQQGNVLTVNQQSHHLNTQWQSFNIGPDATVNFNQPSRSAVAVNQVLDHNASQIMGRLNANGQVFLINPNGVIFTQGAQVNVGGLVASTLGVDRYDSQTGQVVLTGQPASNAKVENHGSIIANGGTVALIAPNVINTGTIRTPDGTTHLTAANQVTLALQDGLLTQYQIDEGVLSALVQNQGAIVADNGAVYLTAQGKDALSQAVVNHSGVIEANRLNQNAKGEIILLADMATGTTQVSGRLSAQGLNEQDGGFIETSAGKVQIHETADVTTLAQKGRTGEWLIDPFNVTISTGLDQNNQQFLPTGNDSVVNVNSLQNALRQNNVTVTTAGSGTQAGDITVDAAITWDANTQLTLSADRNIHINQDITAKHDNGHLSLLYGQASADGKDAQGQDSDYSLQPGVKVNLKAGQNFSTQKGSTGPKINYTVITELGEAGSTTGRDLQGIDGALHGHYVLGADIDAQATHNWNHENGTAQGFKPNGLLPSNTSATHFTGNFDGLGHTISDLYINRPQAAWAGLFGGISHTAQIRHVGLVGGSITGGRYVDGLVGESFGSIHKSYVTGAVSGTNVGINSDIYIGGLVGKNSGSILNSYVTSTVGATNVGRIYSGGLVGLNSGSIHNSYALGGVSAHANIAYVGGLVGGNVAFDTYLGQVDSSYATGEVHAKGAATAYAGGLIGKNGDYVANAGRVSNSHATGNVRADVETSGTDRVFGDSHAGGLIGANSGSLTGSYATGSASALTQIEVDVTPKVVVNGVANAGGLVGLNSGSVEGNFSTGEVEAQVNTTTKAAHADLLSNAHAGGLVGHNSGSLNNNYSTGSALAGSVAQMLGGEYIWDNSHVYSGGLVGYNLGSLRNSYATGAVRLRFSVTSNSGAIGVKHSVAELGGLVGWSDPSAVVSNNFWNVEKSGQADSGVGSGATGKTTAEMQDLETFTAAGWDIDDAGGTGKVWRIYAGQTAPLLRSFFQKEIHGSDVADQNVTYNGTTQSHTVSPSQAADIFVTNIQGRNAGTYTGQYYSHQLGYDLLGGRQATLTINKAQLDLQAAADNRVYDGTTNSAGTVQVFGLKGSDRADSLSQVFDSRDAGNRTLNVTSTYRIEDGNGGANYEVVTRSAQGTITKAPISGITGITAYDRIYNGDTEVGLSYGSATVIGTIFGSDQVTVGQTGSGQMADKHAGQDKRVNISGLSLSGADASNYELINDTAQTTVDIAKAQIANVSGITALDREYDANNHSVALNTATAHFNGMVAGDRLKVDSSQASVANNTVGTQAVVITDMTLGGADAANYTLVDQTASTTVRIWEVTPQPETPQPETPEPITVAWQPDYQYRQATDFMDDRRGAPLANEPIQVEVIGDGINLDGIQTLARGQ